MPKITAETKTYSIKEVAEILKVHEVTIRRKLQSSKISHLKLGKTVRFTQEQLDEYISASTVEKKTNGGESVI